MSKRKTKRPPETKADPKKAPSRYSKTTKQKYEEKRQREGIAGASVFVKGSQALKNKNKKRKKKQMGGPNDPNMQDPNMMQQQQPMQQDPMMDQQSAMAPADDFIEPEMQVKFGAPRDKKFFGGKGRARRQARRAARGPGGGAMGMAKKVLSKTPIGMAGKALANSPQGRVVRGVAGRLKQAMQNRRDRKAGMAQDGGQEAIAQQSAPAATRNPGAPTPAAGPMQKKPMALGAAKNGKRRKASYGMPREKALFGKIAGAIGARKRAKAEGKSRKEIRKATLKGALAGGVLGRAAGAIQGFRKNKGKGLRARLAGAASGAVGGFNDLANKGAADKMRERQAERQQRAKDRKAARKGDKEEKKTVRTPAVPPMTAMAKNGKRKGLKDRRRRKAGGYKIESTESGKMMAATLGVKRNRERAETGKIRRSNRKAAKQKRLEQERRDTSVRADRLVESKGVDSREAKKALKAKQKADKQLRRVQATRTRRRGRGKGTV